MTERGGLSVRKRLHPSIGQIGLGSVGYHFARRLLAAYGRLAVFDSVDAKMHRVRRAHPCRSVVSLAEASDIVVLSLPDPAAVRDVVDGGLLDTLRRGSLVIDTSTIDPETSRAIHRDAAERGIGYLDAPVSSGQPGKAGIEAARSGTFTVLVGGTKSDFRRCLPVMRVLGHRVHHLGAAGSGSTMKLISNHVAAIGTWAVAEGLTLAAAAGFAPRTFFDVMRDTVAQSYVMEDDVRPRIESGDFAPGFSVDLYHKDLRLTASLAEAHKVPLFFNQVAMEMFQVMRAQGRGGRSHIDCVNFLAELAGVTIPAQRPKGVRR
jgi:3-hydroxyisobutyrate dehydrogenase-like beta-hydroxyacid dehydrogenase